jgi:hypothetical protein
MMSIIWIAERGVSQQIGSCSSLHQLIGARNTWRNTSLIICIMSAQTGRLWRCEQVLAVHAGICCTVHSEPYMIILCTGTLWSLWLFLIFFFIASIESETIEGEEGILIILMDPGQYRNLEDTIKAETQVRKKSRDIRYSKGIVLTSDTVWFNFLCQSKEWGHY